MNMQVIREPKTDYEKCMIRACSMSLEVQQALKFGDTKTAQKFLVKQQEALAHARLCKERDAA